ncbi:MAG TPA: Maf family protein [Nannocystaceae bacterium]|nr:Maf family protein [Nannocystaceae bacterium]
MSRGLVLASTSRYRAQLLARIGVPFAIAAPTFDERAHEPAFATTTEIEYATMLARGKADSLRADHGDAWILAADQLAVLPVQAGVAVRTLLHKPGDRDRAIEQLALLAGKTHRLVTAIALLDSVTGRVQIAHDVVELTMRAFPRAEAEAYVDACAPLDCVGSYRIEDAGIRLFHSIAGADPTSIMGLPLLGVCELLRRAGLLAPLGRRA